MGMTDTYVIALLLTDCMKALEPTMEGSVAESPLKSMSDAHFSMVVLVELAPVCCTSGSLTSLPICNVLM